MGSQKHHQYPPNPIRVSMPPALLKGHDQTFIVAGCMIPVPEGTTRADFDRWVIYERPTGPLQVFKVPSSSGGTYTVKQLRDKSWTCSCPGYKFHGRCKHIDSLK